MRPVAVEEEEEAEAEAEARAAAVRCVCPRRAGAVPRCPLPVQVPALAARRQARIPVRRGPSPSCSKPGADGEDC